jgi:hypothetical protein
MQMASNYEKIGKLIPLVWNEIAPLQSGKA